MTGPPTGRSPRSPGCARRRAGGCWRRWPPPAGRRASSAAACATPCSGGPRPAPSSMSPHRSGPSAIEPARGRRPGRSRPVSPTARSRSWSTGKPSRSRRCAATSRPTGGTPRSRSREDFVEDAARRDFTINAMSCDGDGRLFDPFGGRADLAPGRVRFVGERRAGSPRTICASCASSGSSPGTAGRRPTPPRWQLAAEAAPESPGCPASACRPRC